MSTLKSDWWWYEAWQTAATLVDCKVGYIIEMIQGKESLSAGLLEGIWSISTAGLLEGIWVLAVNGGPGSSTLASSLLPWQGQSEQSL